MAGGAVNLFTRSFNPNLSDFPRINSKGVKRGPPGDLESAVTEIQALKRGSHLWEPAQRSGVGNHARYLLVVAV